MMEEAKSRLRALSAKSWNDSVSADAWAKIGDAPVIVIPDDSAVRALIEDYYTTDSHWRQERIRETAQALADAMGVDISQVYTENLAREDFSGVYAGQSALPLKPETMIYLTSDELNGATLFDYETQKTTGLYDLEELWGRDPYDLYLSGAAALQVIDNPAETSGRELVLFRDSFGSSMAPLLVPGYSKITLVDLRYFSSALLEQYVPANGQDVLFLYSPGIMNSTNLLK
jgi:hypothetical protein